MAPIDALGNAAGNPDTGVPPLMEGLWVVLHQAVGFVAEPRPDGVGVETPRLRQFPHREMLLERAHLTASICIYKRERNFGGKLSDFIFATKTHRS